jgi:hypothetical protein
MDALWSVLTDDFGYRLTPLDPGEWWRTLRSSVEAGGEEHHLWPVFYMLDEKKGKIYCRVDNPATVTRDVESRVKAALRKNIRYLLSKGYLPPPPTA